MGNTILENCGVHTDRLIEIANMVKKQKITNGEPINNQTIWNIDNDIYEAYQTILSDLSGLKDGGSIEKAINYLETEIQHSGTTSGIKEVASAITEKVIIEDKNIFYNEENVENKVTENIENEEKVTDINGEIKESHKVLENIFNEKMLQDVDISLHKAQEGDEEATSEMQTIEATINFMTAYPRIESKGEKAALILMQRLDKIGSPAAKQLLEQLAQQYKDKLNVLEIDESGKEVVSTKKIQSLSAEKGVLIDAESINKKSGERALRKSKYVGEKSPRDSKEFAENAKKTSDMNQVRKWISKYSKLPDGIEKLQELYQQYPDEFRAATNERIENCAKLQAENPQNKNIHRLQSVIMQLSDVMHDREERNITQPSQADASKRSRDDEPSL